MDLGLEGRKAIVTGASRGLGRACAESLAREGCEVTIASRSADAIGAAAGEIAERFGGACAGVAADVATEAGRASILAACPAPDILVNNVGPPRSGALRDLDDADWARAIDACLLGPVAMIRAVVDGMAARGFGRIVNVTSNAVRQPKTILTLSVATRMALTGAVTGLAREVAASGVTINNLLPGPFATDSFVAMLEHVSADTGRSYDALLAERVAGIPAGRVGRPEEFGDACAWLCAVRSGYVTAQNILIDGGSYPGPI